MTHYFSQVQLIARPRDSEWLRDLARHGEAYRDHALIWKLFPGDGLPRDFIFRRTVDNNDKARYFVVSRRPPQVDSGLFQVQSKPYQPRLAAGEWLRFDLRANPTVSRRQEGRSSQRHDVLMDAKRSLSNAGNMREAMERAAKDWLLRRAADWGLELREESLLQDNYQQHRLRRKGHHIEFSSLDYQGLARVHDGECLQQALLDGVGHGKGFGCGLLLVKRVN